ncbi:uncharacterized protein K02A2.6-like [Mizuhopecten yessoensis]|uniref:uncharacterized protein K02A2.6-like n=1 Tax=Mizuhopecten yessoensis TaxID=6573 RepID=UPI000B45A438|nr:uncharacterized protein K02A2.6-like [Mizuhopecten yessoensis]
MKSTASAHTIEVLRSVFARNGIPEQLVSDNGPQFTSAECAVFMEMNGIRHTTSAPYHPRTNGLAERFVQTFKQAMKASEYDSGTMQKKLSKFLLAYRTTPQSETPASLLMGRTIETRLDLIKPNLSKSMSVANDQGLLESVSMQRVREFDVGNPVSVRDYRGNHKWTPGVIASQSGPLSYQVQVAPGQCWRRHADQILGSCSPSLRSPSLFGDDAPQVVETDISESVVSVPMDTSASQVQWDTGITLSKVTPGVTPMLRRSKRSKKTPERMDL